MEKCIPAPRDHVNEYAPKIIQIQIDPEKIGDVVGQRGKTINAIIDETGVKIDIDDTGAVSVCGTDQKLSLIHIFQRRFGRRQGRSLHYGGSAEIGELL